MGVLTELPGDVETAVLEGSTDSEIIIDLLENPGDSSLELVEELSVDEVKKVYTDSDNLARLTIEYDEAGGGYNVSSMDYFESGGDETLGSFG
jgi:hypothetical protein